MENEVRSTVEMFGLTKQQIKILYSLEYLLTKRDINSNQKDIIYKVLFTNKELDLDLEDDKSIDTMYRVALKKYYSK